MDREESIDNRALKADARSVHHLQGLIHCELSLLAHHTPCKDDVDWPARQGCVVQASGVMRASGVGGGCAGNGKGKDKAFCEQQAQHDQAAGRACRATIGACDGCLETRHGEGSARTDPEAEAHIAGPISRQRRESDDLYIIYMTTARVIFECEKAHPVFASTPFSRPRDVVSNQLSTHHEILIS